MSAEAIPYPPDQPDSVLYMMVRRIINEEYAETPVDFNAEGLRAGELLAHRRFGTDDTIVDIGSSSGYMIAHAAVATACQARIVALDIMDDARATYTRLREPYRSRIVFAQADGERLPLADSSVQGATLHNVIFRVGDAAALLREVERVVKPGGFVALSSNAQGHACKRHGFERQVAERVAELTETPLTPPVPPAEGKYLSDLPHLIKSIGNLALVPTLQIIQNSRAIITPDERLRAYLTSIAYSAANVPDLPPQHRTIWRNVVNTEVRRSIEAELNQPDSPGYFSDPIRRGMLVLQNRKS